MPPKKKGKGKKKTTSAASKSVPNDEIRVAEVEQSDAILALTEDECKPEWITLDMRLLNWSYMNFRLRVKTTTRLFAVKQMISDRHGRIMDLKICKEQYCERNEMIHDMLTLADYGVNGSKDGEEEKVGKVIYYF